MEVKKNATMSLYAIIKERALSKGTLEKADNYLAAIWPYVNLSPNQLSRLYDATIDYFVGNKN